MGSGPGGEVDPPCSTGRWPSSRSARPASWRSITRFELTEVMAAQVLDSGAARRAAVNDPSQPHSLAEDEHLQDARTILRSGKGFGEWQRRSADGASATPTGPTSSPGILAWERFISASGRGRARSSGAIG